MTLSGFCVGVYKASDSILKQSCITAGYLLYTEGIFLVLESNKYSLLIVHNNFI